MIKNMLLGLLGLVVAWQDPAQRERGLSQSTENAILLAGAVTVAGIVITAITLYVKGHLPGN
ncbi:hypothetical protein FHX74_001201 [Friedmanniella endophytica]|uniref:Uncharacterized protein n=1 Tax=Microlunatus kandeliicorticis TaxID=1759536 RepID=A0A7W3IQX4_9ACTN|nr:hypothetical protein [Microlunatus kandeliicorticis]MBA8793596.1 hypothetical protein [Microlunatus kandeliicorticis]